MSLVEPLIFIFGGAIFSYIAVAALLDKPNLKEAILIPLGLGFCMYCIVAGFTRPWKLDIQSNEAVVYYILGKRTIKREDVISYWSGHEGGGHSGQSRPYVIMKLNSGKKIKLIDLKEDMGSFLAALEQWTGIKPTIEYSEEPEAPSVEETGKKFGAPVPLSERTEQLVQKMFPPEDQYEVRQLLINQCGSNFIEFEDQVPRQIEHFRFAILKTSKGNIKKFRRAVEMANNDFRDPYISSDFYGEEADEKAEKWVQSILGKN